MDIENKQIEIPMELVANMYFEQGINLAQVKKQLGEAVEQINFLQERLKVVESGDVEVPELGAILKQPPK